MIASAKKKVLIVDDEELARRLIIKILTKIDFVEFFEADSGEDAIKMARLHRPNLILMDIFMPEMDGYEACRQIKDDPDLRSTIVLFMTAATGEDIDERIVQAQGDDLLRKPLDASELYFRIKNYLTLVSSATPHQGDRAQQMLEECQMCEEESVINLGQGYLYHPEIKCICKDHQTIHLMKQEILLLEALLQHRNKVVTFDQLVDAISGDEFSSVANIRTLVKQIRRKTYQSLIRNLHSVGYQLIIAP